MYTRDFILDSSYQTFQINKSISPEENIFSEKLISSTTLVK